MIIKVTRERQLPPFTRIIKLLLGYTLFLLLIAICAHFVSRGFSLNSPIVVGLSIVIGLLLITLFTTRLANLLRIPIGILNLPVYWLALVIPKRKNLWLFTCRQGNAYAENSKYLYEHINANHPEINAVWLTKNKAVFNMLRGKGLPVVKAFSVRGYFYSLQSGCLFMSNFQRRAPDYNDFAIGLKTIKIQLWHGSPMKRIGKHRPSHNQMSISYLIRCGMNLCLPFYANRTSCHKMVAASPEVAQVLKDSFGLSDSNLWIAGYPKNDQWLKRAMTKPPERNVIFLPTWRLDDLTLFTHYNFDPVELNNFLTKYDIHFHIKLHHFSLENLKCEFKELTSLSNISIVEIDDIYQVLDQYDVLVTDYSSILFDYLLCGKPVVFTPFDYQDYIQNDQGFLRDYSTYTVGPVAKNWKELEAALLQVFEKDEFAESREQLKDLFNYYKDTNSAERLVNMTEELLETVEYKPLPAFH